MDFLTFIERIVDHIVWPGVLIWCLYFFRERLGNLANRIIELVFPGGGTIKFDKPSHQQTAITSPDKGGLEKTEALPYYLRASPDIEPYIQQTEKTIHKDLETIPAGQREQVLVRNLVFSQYRASFEYIYNVIFGAQLRLLQKALQALAEGLSHSDVILAYEELLKAMRVTTGDFSLLNFVGFLTDNRLLRFDADNRYRLTDLGRAFVAYLVSTGRSLSKIP